MVRTGKDGVLLPLLSGRRAGSVSSPNGEPSKTNFDQKPEHMMLNGVTDTAELLVHGLQSLGDSFASTHTAITSKNYELAGFPSSPASPPAGQWRLPNSTDVVYPSRSPRG